MNTRPGFRFIDSVPSPALWGCGIMVAAAMGLVGCRESSKSVDGGLGDVPLERNEEEAVISSPATVADAAQALDLSRLPLMNGAERPSERIVTSLAYRATGQPEAAFKFHQEQLIARGWKELPGSSVTPQYASGVFAKRGLNLSLVAMPGQSNKVSIALRHHGNIKLGNLPVPSGAKSIFAGPSTAIFAVEGPVEIVAREIDASLQQAGWERYGSAANTQWFKQNAVKLSVMTAVAPAQGGRTTINFSSEMLPVDVPVPASATDVLFHNARKRLTFAVALTEEECFAFYREALARKGWDCRMKAPVKNDGDRILVFETPGKDILRLGMRANSEGQLRVFAEHMSAAEIEEMNRKLDAQAAAYKAAKAGAGKAQ